MAEFEAERRMPAEAEQVFANPSSDYTRQLMAAAFPISDELAAALDPTEEAS